MLIRFAIENWMSFRERAEFSMVATREQQHREQVTKYARMQMRILPAGFLFGGNASGKSNFFRALAFCKGFITKSYLLPPERPIPVMPFLLDNESRNKPSRFEFVILIGDEVYKYRFTCDATHVYEEALNRLTCPKAGFSFERKIDPDTLQSSILLGAALKPEQPLYDLIARATAPNRLFLSAAVAQNVTALRPLYDWFRETLQLVSPTAHYASIERYASESWIGSRRMNELLAEFDTGIAQIRRTPIERAQIPLPAPILEEIEQSLTEGTSTRIFAPQGGPLPYMVTRKDGAFVYEKISAHHVAPGLPSGICDFELQNESDGTNRLLELLPALVDLERAKSSRVYVIDEIDRCLHAMATRRFLRLFKESRTTETRSQLLATSHTASLLDQTLLRRDEMWFVERTHKRESSKLFSVAEYEEARKDKDLVRSYLEGRMGGIQSIDNGGD